MAASEFNPATFLARSGLTSQEVGVLYGYMQHLIRKFASGNDATARKPRDEMAAEVFQELARLRMQGLSEEAIGRHFGVCRQTVRRWADYADNGNVPANSSLYTKGYAVTFAQRQIARRADAVCQ